MQRSANRNANDTNGPSEPELDEEDYQNMRRRMEMIRDAYENEEDEGSSDDAGIVGGNQSIANTNNDPLSARPTHEDNYGMGIPTVGPLLSPLTARSNFLQLQQQQHHEDKLRKQSIAGSSGALTSAMETHEDMKSKRQKHADDLPLEVQTQRTNLYSVASLHDPLKKEAKLPEIDQHTMRGMRHLGDRSSASANLMDEQKTLSRSKGKRKDKKPGRSRDKNNKTRLASNESLDDEMGSKNKLDNSSFL